MIFFARLHAEFLIEEVLLMRKFIRPLVIGLAAFLFGAGGLFFFLRGNPELARGVLGLESGKSSKQIVPALQLGGQKEEEAQRRAVPPVAEEEGEDPFSSFFGGQDPFAAAQKFHKQMEKEMQEGFAGVTISGSGEDIVTKEDDRSVSFEIKGVDGSSLSTSVKNGYLTISGETKQEKGNFSFRSSFHRMFPLPADIDSSKMETISEKDKVVLRFPKKNS